MRSRSSLGNRCARPISIAACRDGPREHGRQAARSEGSARQGKARQTGLSHVRAAEGGVLITLEVNSATHATEHDQTIVSRGAMRHVGPTRS
jgi:hypothetical protein